MGLVFSGEKEPVVWLFVHSFLAAWLPGFAQHGHLWGMLNTKAVDVATWDGIYQIRSPDQSGENVVENVVSVHLSGEVYGIAVECSQLVFSDTKTKCQPTWNWGIQIDTMYI